MVRVLFNFLETLEYLLQHTLETLQVLLGVSKYRGDTPNGQSKDSLIAMAVVKEAYLVVMFPANSLPCRLALDYSQLCTLD